MCKYCDDRSDASLDYGDISVWIIGYHKKAEMQINAEYEYEGHYDCIEASIPINYCPVCGEKLHGGEDCGI